MKLFMKKKKSNEDAKVEDENAEKGKPIVSSYPTREWNVGDFTGKYHLSKFSNKLTPLPGSQVKIENEYDANKALFDAYLEEQRKKKQEELRMKLMVKQQSVGVKTKVYFDTILGQPIEAAEKIMYEKEALLEQINRPKYADDAREIDRFWKSMLQGKYHYVGYIVSNGFKSIDYQDPQTGDCALHIACRQGNVNMVEELLKYKANPDVKNRLGNYPIHDCWYFWNVDTNTRTQEERLKQEDTTCRLLLTLLSYNGFVDAQNLHLETALHIACRMGTCRAVKILVTFRADLDLKTKYMETAMSLAEEFQQEESCRLLGSWDNIRKHFLHTDFHVIWYKFLQDSEAVMQQSKSAEVILSELELEKNAKQMERMGREVKVYIDDPLLSAALQCMKQDSGAKAPKPWEPGWKKFVKQVKNAGVVDLETRMKMLKGKLKGNQKAALTTEVAVDGSPSPTKLGPPKKREFPDKPAPLSWEETHLPPVDEMDLLENGDDSTDPRSMKLKKQPSLFHNVFQPNSNLVNHHPDSLKGKNYVEQRRLNLAHKVCVDAKFLKFTKRLTTDSALLLPLRTPQAPMKNTEEDGNVLRMIVSQGYEYERMEKYRQRDKLEEMLGISKKPKKNSIGAYNEELGMTSVGERNRLLDSIASTKFGTDLMRSGPQDKASTTIEFDKMPKVDLVNDRRPRYVDPKLLPGNKVLSQVDIMIKEQEQKKKDDMLKKQNLGTDRDKDAARLAMEAMIAQAQSTDGATEQESEEADHSIHFSSAVSKQRAAHEKQRTMNKLFLGKEEVKYGTGRLQSTHNMKGKIEEPWVTTGGRYHTLPGDRTA